MCAPMCCDAALRWRSLPSLAAPSPRLAHQKCEQLLMPQVMTAALVYGTMSARAGLYRGALMLNGFFYTSLAS